jgi:hypothetical protein
MLSLYISPKAPTVKLNNKNQYFQAKQELLGQFSSTVEQKLHHWEEFFLDLNKV